MIRWTTSHHPVYDYFTTTAHHELFCSLHNILIADLVNGNDLSHSYCVILFVLAALEVCS